MNIGTVSEILEAVIATYEVVSSIEKIKNYKRKGSGKKLTNQEIVKRKRNATRKEKMILSY